MVGKCIGSAIKSGIYFGFVSLLVSGLLLSVIFRSLGWDDILIIAGVISLAASIIGTIVGYKEAIDHEDERRHKILKEEAERRQKLILEEVERRRKNQQEEDMRLRRHKEEQDAALSQMVVLGEESLELFESMPKHLDEAEKCLDQAETDFGDGAFAPFWDSVERAANCLAHFDKVLRQLKDKSSRYTELIGHYEDTPPRFPLSHQSVKKLNIGTAIAERMANIVRRGQRNFQFAVIYEQRKTNKILVKGFTNLARALEEMKWQITASFDDLANSVQTLINSVDRISETTGQHYSELTEQVSEITNRESKIVEILDKIQSKR